jgi:uncharacterized membrane protein YdjX (TVP38/TMEM64 family)
MRAPSVDLGSYVLGSWLGMLPGTYASVHAGTLGRAVLLEGGGGSVSVGSWEVRRGSCWVGWLTA